VNGNPDLPLGHGPNCIINSPKSVGEGNGTLVMIAMNRGTLESGNIRYIPDSQVFKWQQKWLQGGNRLATEAFFSRANGVLLTNVDSQKILLSPALSSTSVWRRGRWNDAQRVHGFNARMVSGESPSGSSPALPARGEREKSATDRPSQVYI